MPIKVCVFDAYGTLFDVASAARELALQPGRERLKNCWVKLANDWRHKQLQYSWLRAIMNKHTDFWSVTQDGLDWALEANNLSDDSDLRKELLKLYFNLTAYPEVFQMLSDLRSNHILTGILSNGSPDMLNGAVQSAGISDLLNEVISVEDVGVFKPDISVYELVEKRFGCEIREVLFVSSNCWDACAAASFGFQTGWVNRSNEPKDRLPSGNLVIMKDLADIATLVVK